jgi:HSP20 family protein
MALKSLVPWKREDRQLADRRDVDFPFHTLSRQIDPMFDNMLSDWISPGFFNRNPLAFAPRVEITETDKEVKVVAEMAGLTDKDIEVQVENGMLVLRGEKRDEHKEERQGSWLLERRFGSFERMINLPDAIDLGSAQAAMKHGVLTVTFSKTPEAQTNRRKIEVKAD